MDAPENSSPPARTWPFAMKLKHPIAFGDDTITVLEFRRGRLEDAKGVRPDQTPSIDELILIASRLCGKPMKVIGLLDPDDAGEVISLALAFFARCLGAGS